MKLIINILSIKKDIRSVGRIECFSQEEVDFFLKKIKDFSLYYKIVSKSDEVKSKEVKVHIYFSKNKKNKEKIDRLIELYQSENRNDEAFVKTNKEAGKIYGYPDCCIDWFTDFLISWLAENKKKQIGFIEPSQDLINLEILANSNGDSFDKSVNICQNDSPLFHLPHSFNCKKSINIGKDNLKILKEYNKELFLEYQEYLKGRFKVSKDKIIKLEECSKLNKRDRVIYFK